MNHSRLALGLMLSVLCGGCAFDGLSRVMGPQDGGAIQLTARLNGTRYDVQADGGYTSADVNHLILMLFTVSGGSESAVVGAQGNQVLKDLPKAEFANPITFSHLHPDTTYRIKAYAYSDAATASLISTQDASSSVDVVVAKDDRPVLANIPVQLLPRIFNGQATASAIVVNDGGVTDPGLETIN